MSDALDLIAAAREAGSRGAWIDAEGSLSFVALAEASRATSGRWPSLAPGDRVVITPHLERESALAILALLDRRATIVLAHPRWSEVERDRVIARVRPRLVLNGSVISARGGPERGGPAGRAEGAVCPQRVRQGRRAKAPARASVIVRHDDVDPRDPHEHAPAVVVFTSGTSGAPKGVYLSRRALIAATQAHAAALPWSARDRWLLAMPLAHVGGLSILLRSLAARRAVVLGPDRFEPRALLEAAREHAATLMSLVPTMLERILPAKPPPSVRAVLLGGASCPGDLLRRGREAGWPLLPSYGLSECCAQVCTQRRDSPRPSGVGPPLPGVEVRIVDGIVEVRGPTRMDGYLGEPALEPDAWVRTGDRGALDEEGHLHVAGREDDLIVTGGENVDPLAVEEALVTHPDVAAACVVGLDDPRWGQRVAALIVAQEPARPPSAQALAAYLEGRLATFARPRSWAFVSALPLNGAGKIDRRAARERVGS